jgi:hypothetical protein
MADLSQIATPKTKAANKQVRLRGAAIEDLLYVGNPLTRSSKRGEPDTKTPSREIATGRMGTNGSTALMRRSITRRSLGLNMIVGLGGLHGARSLTGSGWLSPKPGRRATPVVLYKSVPASFYGAWAWSDNNTSGLTQINRKLQFIINTDASAEMTYGLVQSQINGCTQQDIWDLTGNWAWDVANDELQFQGSGTHYRSFTLTCGQNITEPTSGPYTFPSVKVGANSMSLDPSGSGALNLKDLNTSPPQPLTQITLTKTASPPAEAWGNWEKLDGYLTQGLAVASWAENRLDVFAAGADQTLNHKWWNAIGGWSAWERLGGIFSGVPAAVSWGPGRLDIFVVATDRTVWHLYFGNGTWSGWEPMGGTVQPYGVAAASPGVNQLAVYAVGIDNNIYVRAFGLPTPGWTGWQKVPSFSVSAPAAAGYASNGLLLGCVGTGNNLYYTDYYNSTYHPWNSLGPTCLDVALSTWGPSRFDFFVRSSDMAVYQRTWDGSSWHSWVDLGGVLTYPVAAVSRAPNSIDLLGVGLDHALYQKSYN